jgi:hypothetical protein
VLAAAGGVADFAACLGRLPFSAHLIEDRSKLGQHGLVVKLGNRHEVIGRDDAGDLAEFGRVPAVAGEIANVPEGDLQFSAGLAG